VRVAVAVRLAARFPVGGCRHVIPGTFQP
jgi:hypothetical protein